MSGKRAAGQTLIAVALDEQLLAMLDDARGNVSRSQFLREAIAEKLADVGLAVPATMIHSAVGRPIKSIGIQVNGHGNTVTQHLSTSPSAVPPRRGAKTAKAGKPRNPRTKK